MGVKRLALTAILAATTAQADTTTRHACTNTAGFHCLAQIQLRDGAVPHLLGPQGFTPADLQAAYHIDPELGDGATVAVVDAFGYPKLESDLATYRSQFGLPPCTIASGCLRIVNETGTDSPLPDPPSGEAEDWTVETALDVDMVSAACPRCKIVVVQAQVPGLGLFAANPVGKTLGATAISNSWGGPEFDAIGSYEGYFNLPGVATFASSGDYGYNGDLGFALYPSTSHYVVGVGGTSMVVDPTGPRGFTETAWQYAGSSCSTHVAAPVFQPLSAACQGRAASDVSAVADPATGLAVFDSDNGNPGWMVIGGTSAASPLMAALFAAAGHGDVVPAFFYKHPELFTDVVSGSNGMCKSAMCDAGSGWDGPTGVGTPDQAVIAAIGNGSNGPVPTVTYPPEGATVVPDYGIEVTADDTTSYVQVFVDGVLVDSGGSFPFDTSLVQPSAEGPHVLEARGFDVDRNMGTVTVHFTVAAPTPPMDGGGCSAGTRVGGALMGAAAALLFERRRRRNSARS